MVCTCQTWAGWACQGQLGLRRAIEAQARHVETSDTYKQIQAETIVHSAIYMTKAQTILSQICSQIEECGQNGIVR